MKNAGFFWKMAVSPLCKRSGRLTCSPRWIIRGRILIGTSQVTAYRAITDHADRLMRKAPEQRSAREQRRLTDYFVRRHRTGILRSTA